MGRANERLSFLTPFDKSSEFNELIRCIKENITPVNVITGVGAQRAHLIFAAQKKMDLPAFVITSTELAAQSLCEDLEFFAPERVVYFPSREYVYYDVDSVSREMSIKRLSALSRLADTKENCIVVASIEAALGFCTPKQDFAQNIIDFTLGEVCEIETLIKKLVVMGYKREDVVEGCGQFSVRGGIVDIFGADMENPVRIEFFDDEIDSIRTFDVSTQLSIEKIERVRVYPCREIIFDEEGKMALLESMKTSLSSLKRKRAQSAQRAREQLEADMESLCEKYYFASLDKYIFDIYKRVPTIFDWLCDDAMFFIDEVRSVGESAKIYENSFSETIASLMEKGVILPEKKPFWIEYGEIINKLSQKRLVGLCAMSFSGIDYRAKQNIDFGIKSINSFHGKIDFLCDDIRMWHKKRASVVILAGGQTRAQNLCTELNNRNIECVYSPDIKSITKGKTVITTGSLSSGFEYPLLDFVLISDKEIFLKSKRKSRKAANAAANKIQSFADISPGDYVVHQTHGIGRYEGIQKLEVDKVIKDYLKISYQGTDNLYVPVDQLDLLYKYIGGTDKKVHVNKLGGVDWNKTKERVKRSAAELAEHLIKLYAERQSTKGYAFGPDTPWQREFEDNFGYIETPDQMRSIEEVKKDMESERPMDRLLCGDVGYGKTEVAMRAAFKSVMESKQVAYLVPTTILAMQHYNNFMHRMSDFPVRVEMLSRFRTPAQQKETLKRLKTGETDIVIGTHRLLQKDIEFKDLGLLIVDEEQRFGVAHKESIKQMRKNVDVLTLTATPIPRTLHMAMVNIRDMSVITQPPENRYPVQTYVMEKNDDILADAIRKEIARGGQVYYLYNRVSGIHSVAKRIQELVPEAKVGVGHGKMREDELEDVMMDMLDGQINVLVCTTIIETGLDIPNVNTIIIENADKMGLSQLYQLRGRVGRSNRLAYAYMTYQRDKSISDVAQKRLSAVREFTEFGSGFKIAMRDLEIRGAGNLLGPQQHGHMDAVGYDMYCKLLKESVNEIKGEVAEDEVNTTVDLPIDAHIPESYIKNQNLRIDIYKKIAAITSLADSYDVEEELEDRFGDLPQSVRNIIDIALIKAMAKELYITEVSHSSRGLMLLFEPSKVDMRVISHAVAQSKGNALFSAGEQPYLLLRRISNIQKELLGNIKFLLQSMKELQ
ncbi:MAG: transcription-repair coupling factor [Ruminococcaceae bacterium]|nr:transcription-repair coupling factor [Oscillospiraceae bacterium]